MMDGSGRQLRILHRGDEKLCTRKRGASLQQYEPTGIADPCEKKYRDHLSESRSPASEASLHDLGLRAGLLRIGRSGLQMLILPDISVTRNRKSPCGSLSICLKSEVLLCVTEHWKVGSDSSCSAGGLSRTDSFWSIDHLRLVAGTMNVACV